MNFEEKVLQLEQLLKKLENNQLPLEEAINEFKRGQELIKELKEMIACSERLIDAEEK